MECLWGYEFNILRFSSQSEHQSLHKSTNRSTFRHVQESVACGAFLPSGNGQKIKNASSPTVLFAQLLLVLSFLVSLQCFFPHYYYRYKYYYHYGYITVITCIILLIYGYLQKRLYKEAAWCHQFTSNPVNKVMLRESTCGLNNTRRVWIEQGIFKGTAKDENKSPTACTLLEVIENCLQVRLHHFSSSSLSEFALCQM